MRICKFVCSCESDYIHSDDKMFTKADKWASCWMDGDISSTIFYSILKHLVVLGHVLEANDAFQLIDNVLRKGSSGRSQQFEPMPEAVANRMWTSVLLLSRLNLIWLLNRISGRKSHASLGISQHIYSIVSILINLCNRYRMLWDSNNASMYMI